MNYLVEITAVAQIDIDGAASWYENQQSGLGRRFLERVYASIAKLEVAPGMYRIVNRIKGIRSLSCSDFPYRLFYYISDANVVRVIAVIDHSRGSDYRFQRLKGF